MTNTFKKNLFPKLLDNEQSFCYIKNQLKVVSLSALAKDFERENKRSNLQIVLQ